MNELRIGGLCARIPVIQGGMGVGVSLSGLAGAVAAAGGVGVISTAQIGFRDPDFGKHPIACNLKAVGDGKRAKGQTAALLASTSWWRPESMRTM